MSQDDAEAKAPPAVERAEPELASALGPASARSDSPAEPATPQGSPSRRESDADSTDNKRARTMPPPPDRSERDRQARAETPPPPGRPLPADPVPADDEWPAPARPAKQVDPDDWQADAQQQEQIEGDRPSTGPAVATPPPAVASESASHPPPTRPAVAHATVKATSVAPVPEVPEGGFIAALTYTVAFARARWQRRQAIKSLREQIVDDTSDLDSVLGTLGAQVRALGVDNRALHTENQAIDEAEGRRHAADHECADLSNRRADENAKFAEIEGDRVERVTDVEGALEKSQQEQASFESQRRSLRDKRKTIERQQKGYLKVADDRDTEAGKAVLGDQRTSLRRAGEDLRRDAANLDPERQDIERRLAALDKPISQATAKTESLKAELQSVRRSLNDAREGHRHRLAENEAEQGRKTRELAQAEAEIQRRLVTLGTLVNLNRIDDTALDDLYARIDGLRGAIGTRSNEIDRLAAEREAYDKKSLVRGGLVMGAGVVALVTLIVIILAVT